MKPADESLQLISEEESHAVDDVTKKDSTILDEILSVKAESTPTDGDKRSGVQQPKEVTVSQVRAIGLLVIGLEVLNFVVTFTWCSVELVVMAIDLLVIGLEVLNLVVTFTWLSVELVVRAIGILLIVNKITAFNKNKIVCKHEFFVHCFHYLCHSLIHLAN